MRRRWSSPGVYLVARMFPLYIGYAPDVLHWVAYIGAFTALYAAVVACVQSDIKRVLAFSTISQIGFMLVALGVCTSSDPHTGGLGYMASMFHLFTHAMFKALLFLCAGCIIHAVHSNEMSAMGGMRKYMPVTHITFLVACLAIAGIWPLSGFFSKDEILTACFAFSPLMGWVMTGIAGLTAFYMFRLYYGIFWGKENKELHAHHTPHEAPATMTVPLVVLAVITCVAGFIPFGDFISSDGEAYTIHLDGGVVAISLTVAIAAIALATLDVPAGQTARRRPARHDLQRPAQGGLPPLLHRRGVSVRHAPNHLRLHFASDRLVRPSRGGRLHEPTGPDNPERRTGDPLHAERQRTALLHLVLCRDARPDPFVTHPPIIRTL